MTAFEQVTEPAGRRYILTPGGRASILEFIYMLQGEMIYAHSARTYRLRPGDSLLFDAEGIHGPEKLIELPIRFLSVMVSPKTS